VFELAFLFSEIVAEGFALLADGIAAIVAIDAT